MKRAHIFIGALLIATLGVEAFSGSTPKRPQVKAKFTPAAPTMGFPIAATEKAFSPFTLRTRGTLWGTTGKYTSVDGQVLMPIMGDNSHVLYGLAEGNKVFSGDKSWLAGAGIGYRKVVGERIYGGYLIADYNKHFDGKGFLIANIGAEILGKEWDFNVNGYLPSASKKYTYSSNWAEEYGIYKYGSLHDDHTYHDHWIDSRRIENVGRGFDFKVGHVVPRLEKAKVYLGGYYFNTSDAGNIKGVSAKVTYDISKYAALELANMYDNYNHNRTTLGVKLSFGGYSEREKNEFGISSRLLDPVERGYGNTIVPIVVKNEYTDGFDAIRYYDVWAVQEGISDATAKRKSAVVGRGTATDPLIGLTYDNYNYIRANKKTANPIIFLASGVYNLTDGGFSSGEWLLHDGISVYGRSVDYKPVSGDARPEIDGVLTLQGNNTADSIRMMLDSNRGLTPEGIIQLDNAQNVWLRNVLVGVPTITKDFGGYNVGVWMSNNSSIYLSDVTIYGANDGKYGCAGADCLSYGIKADMGSSINIISGTNNIISNTEYGTKASAYGISGDNGSTINISGGVNNILANSDGYNLDIPAHGIFVGRGSVMNFDGGVNNVRVKAKFDLAEAYGVHAKENSQVNFHGGENMISSVAEGGNEGEPEGHGILLETSSAVNFLGGTNVISSSSTAELPKAYGVYALSGSTVVFSGGINAITAQASGNGVKSVYGIKAESNSQVILNGGTNTISVVSNTSSGVEQNGIYGVHLSNSTLVLSGGNNNVVVDAVTGRGQEDNLAFGIYANNGSSLKIGTSSADSPQSLLQYVNINRSAGSYGGGYKIQWVGHWSPGNDYLSW
jgi:hypothetical protein